MAEIEVHQSLAVGEPLRFGQDVEVEVCGAARRLGNLAPGISENPADEVAGRLVVERVLRHSPREEGEVVEGVEELLAEGAVRTKEVALHLAVDFQHERGLGLDVGVVTRQVVREEFTVLEDGVDRLAEVAGLAAEPADGLPVAPLEAADDGKCAGGGDFPGGDGQDCGHPTGCTRQSLPGKPQRAAQRPPASHNVPRPSRQR